MNVRIESEIEKRIKEYCSEKNITVSDFVRRAINDELENYFIADKNLKREIFLNNALITKLLLNFIKPEKEYLKNLIDIIDKEYKRISENS